MRRQRRGGGGAIDWFKSPLIAAYRAGVFHATALRLELWPESTAGFPPAEPVCRAIAGAWPGCALCRRSRFLDRSPAGGRLATMRCRCFEELVRYAGTVQIGNQRVGILSSGHVLLHPRAAITATRAMGRLSGILSLAQQQVARAGYARVPVVAAPRVEAAMQGLAALVASLPHREQCCSQEDRSVEPAAIVAARRFVEEHLDQSISLAAVAREVRLSRFHLCHLFKQWSGLTFTEYITRRRVTVAQALLADSGKRVTEVALAAGFGSMARFYCAFKCGTGLSPIEFRRRAVCGRAKPQESSFPVRL